MKISCIMLTRHRPRLAQRAVVGFLTQTWHEAGGKAELIVLDDGDSPFPHVIQDPRIRYFRVQHPGANTVGTLRNMAIDVAEGELIAHWDDDDYSHPERLVSQHEQMGIEGVSVVGYRDLLFLDSRAKTPQLWLYASPRSNPYAVGTSLFYERAFWQTHKFQDLDVAEDGRFIDAARDIGQLRGFTSFLTGTKPVVGGDLVFPGEAYMIARIHGQNSHGGKLLDRVKKSIELCEAEGEENRSGWEEVKSRPSVEAAVELLG